MVIDLIEWKKRIFNYNKKQNSGKILEVEVLDILENYGVGLKEKVGYSSLKRY